MKMKKLTALALAGVLCLGMSTTAFAEEIVTPDGNGGTVAPAEPTTPEEGSLSNTQDDGNATIDAAKKAKIPSAMSNKPNEGNNATETDRKGEIKRLEIPTECKDWIASNEEEAKEASEAIRTDLKKVLKDAKQNEGKITGNDKEAYDKTITMMESLGLDNEDNYYEVITLDNLHYDFDKDYVDPNGNKGETLKIRFDLKAKKLKPGQTVRLLHQVEFGVGSNKVVSWEVFELVVQEDEEDGTLYVEHTFKDLSPVAIIRVQDDGTLTPGTTGPTGTPGTTETPGTTDDGSTLAPGTNGSITAEQLAELIAQKLEENARNAKYVRAASGKASPKTGE